MAAERQNVQASVLDRLIDLEPGVSHEPVQFRLQDFGQIRASVVRDLEKLLNTTNSVIEDPPAAYRHLNRSLMVYGLRDMTSCNPGSAAGRQHLRLEIEQVIERFEPRIRNVSVHLETDAGDERALRFRISGILKVEPLSEPVTFDTVLDVNKVQFSVAS